MKVIRRLIAAVIFLDCFAPCQTDPAPVIHYAPGENLAALDHYAGRTMQVEPTWNGN
jgi:hypothetical protein